MLERGHQEQLLPRGGWGGEVEALACSTRRTCLRNPAGGDRVTSRWSAKISSGVGKLLAHFHRTNRFGFSYGSCIPFPFSALPASVTRADLLGLALDFFLVK
jgi:hypothetical protein